MLLLAASSSSAPGCRIVYEARSSYWKRSFRHRSMNSRSARMYVIFSRNVLKSLNVNPKLKYSSGKVRSSFYS